MDIDPISSDARRARRFRELKLDVECFHCGLRAPEALLSYWGRHVLEVHHVAGRRIDPTLGVTLCLNCHAIATEGQAAAGVELGEPAKRSDLRRATSFFAAVAEHFRMVAESVDRQVGELRGFLAFLDDQHPGWREAYAAWREEVR